MNTTSPSFPPPPPLSGSEFAAAYLAGYPPGYDAPKTPVSKPPIFEDSAPERLPEFAAALKRETVFRAMHERQWRGVPLQPWSKERDTLFARLVEMDLPGESLDGLPGMVALYEVESAKDPKFSPLEQIIDVSLYLSSAAKLLWLALHDEGEILRLRTRPQLFLSTVDKWSAENITDAEVFDACLLAAKIKNEWKQFRPMYRPSGRTGNADSGN